MRMRSTRRCRIPINLLTYQPIRHLPLPSVPITHPAPPTTHLLYLIFPSHNSSKKQRELQKRQSLALVHMEDSRNKQDKFSNSFPFTSKFQIPNPWPVISAPFSPFQYLQTEKGKCMTC
ncbi:hypothetical protein EYC84_009651 [Monilinia fructicola]|uniref:Uncharacterized protein n=1 Tax=Monilinia fructicola TaxID=38448 RepID=A0A5M9J9A9_MONFR|nr:hypothetical protein EYC84_009651 [Monilinia fructicola]